MMIACPSNCLYLWFCAGHYFKTLSWYVASGMKGLLCSNDDRRFIFALLMARSNLFPPHLYEKNAENNFLIMY